MKRTAAALLALGCAWPVFATDDDPPPPVSPNIVMIMTDDLDMSVWATALSKGYLPRIKADLIDKGTTFTEVFASEPTCCPSRTTYLTGQYAHTHGVITNGGPNGGFASFKKDVSTLPVWLKAAGYRTGLVGKYLNGYSKLDKTFRYVPPGWDTWNAMLSTFQFDYAMSINGVLRSYGHADADYQTDVLAGHARDFIHQPDARPFFLTLTPTAPHYELATGQGEDDGTSIRPAARYANTEQISAMPEETEVSFNEADMSDKPGWMRSRPVLDAIGLRLGYNSKLAAMRAVDDMVGTVIDTLREAGKEENTLIVFTSDNGFQYGTHRQKGKFVMYEESIRLPTVIRAPGQTLPRSSAAWVMNNDWAPTFVDFAHASADIPFDGRSIRGLIEGSASDTGRLSVLIELPIDSSGTETHKPYRMIRTKDPSITNDAGGHRTLVYSETLNTAGGVASREFYDLADDPLQLASLHASTVPARKTQRQKLGARVSELQNCRAADCRRLED